MVRKYSQHSPELSTVLQWGVANRAKNSDYKKYASDPRVVDIVRARTKQPDGTTPPMPVYCGDHDTTLRLSLLVRDDMVMVQAMTSGEHESAQVLASQHADEIGLKLEVTCPVCGRRHGALNQIEVLYRSVLSLAEAATRRPRFRLT